MQAAGCRTLVGGSHCRAECSTEAREARFSGYPQFRPANYRSLLSTGGLQEGLDSRDKSMG